MEHLGLCSVYCSGWINLNFCREDAKARWRRWQMPAIRLESKFILASLCSFLEDREVREVFEVLDLIQEHKC